MKGTNQYPERPQKGVQSSSGVAPRSHGCSALGIWGKQEGHEPRLDVRSQNRSQLVTTGCGSGLLLGFSNFLYVNFAPRNETHIPWLKSPNQGKTKTRKQPPPRTLLKNLVWIPEARVVKWIGLFKTYTVFRHRSKSAPLFLPHKRKANLCLMANNFWQLLPFKLLQGQDDYLERQITDHLDRRLCHVDPL